MLLPYQVATLTIEDAKALINFIVSKTSEGNSRNYKAIIESGLMRLFNELEDFVKYHDQYEDEFKYLDTSTLSRID